MTKEYEIYIKETKEREVYLDRIRGSLIGGAAGDALGYAVEFDREHEIFRRYGEKGIREYELDPVTGKALVSDDTQMTLFTANGILLGETRGATRGVGGPPSMYVGYFYEEWLETQNTSYRSYWREKRSGYRGNKSWLMHVPELFASRAPGMTCLSAISGEMGSIEEPVNNSKGCGGIMRIAPLGMRYHFRDMRELDREGAQIAALTHGHSLGYMPAAMLTHIVSILVHQPDLSLQEVIQDARTAMIELFAEDSHLDELIGIVDLAVSLAGNDQDDLTNIHRLGEGWVAEETLAIALYCSLRYTHDFSKALTVSVNHNGDSDSTGAVTGNIVGAIVGFDAMDDQWKQDLELYDVLLEMADDLCHGCRMASMFSYDDRAWCRRYGGGEYEKGATSTEKLLSAE